jgi:hypothetical protein
MKKEFVIDFVRKQIILLGNMSYKDFIFDEKRK